MGKEKAIEIREKVKGEGLKKFGDMKKIMDSLDWSKLVRYRTFVIEEAIDIALAEQQKEIDELWKFIIDVSDSNRDDFEEWKKVK